MFAPFADSCVNDSLLKPMQHLSQSLLQFADITNARLIADLGY